MSGGEKATRPAILPRLDEWKDRLEDGREKRRAELVEALTVERGSVKNAAERLELSRQRVTILVKEMGLGDFARALRAKRG